VSSGNGGKGGWKIGMNIHSNDMFLVKQTSQSAKKMRVDASLTPDLKKMYKLDLSSMDVDSFNAKMFLAKNYQFVQFLDKLGPLGEAGVKIKDQFMKLSPADQKLVMKEATRLKVDRFYNLVDPLNPNAK